MFSTPILSASRAAMLSPQKNPCRIRVNMLNNVTAGITSWYRYDPYVSKVVPSPMKTPSTPTTFEAEALQQLHKNSLFAAAPTASRSFLKAAEAPVTPAPAAIIAPDSMTEKPRSVMTHYAVVNFKHESVTYIAPFRIVVGDHVFVEGDRGEDIGVISEIFTETPTYPVPCRIVRRASARDKEQLAYKTQKEDTTVKAVQQMADSLGMNIRIADTEFQFDMNKLTVFFDSKVGGHIDFRKLQRGLFREFRCRIWLSNMAEIEHNNRMQKVRRTR